MFLLSGKTRRMQQVLSITLGLAESWIGIS
jgi:hypothetical protein